jgi:hypothetical protein
MPALTRTKMLIHLPSVLRFMPTPEQYVLPRTLRHEVSANLAKGQSKSK